VPLLELDDGQRLSEGPAIVQYLADKVPHKNLVPAAGTMERYRQIEWLNFIGTEIHKGLSPVFNPATPDETKKMAKDKVGARLKWVDEQLEGHAYLMGDTFTAADAYLFTVTNWAKPISLDISALKNLGAFRERVAARPAVQAAMKAEGLLK
jgi:glutathione S-transferase